ncbi:hypothetical protein B0H16DRAFT_1470064 [Mycena metata]|uniref:Uncharacterized protein n=1 Tax=Mycena metata TaxID=1033252 RepID=A0AAD7MR18_9AGAR|nr:hypothetical protein B0H16DRAFT_1470064 [Mycena metata]
MGADQEERKQYFNKCPYCRLQRETCQSKREQSVRIWSVKEERVHTSFKAVYENFVKEIINRSPPTCTKLHTSANWPTPYMTRGALTTWGLHAEDWSQGVICEGKNYSSLNPDQLCPIQVVESLQDVPLSLRSCYYVPIHFIFH